MKYYDMSQLSQSESETKHKIPTPTPVLYPDINNSNEKTKEEL